MLTLSRVPRVSAHRSRSGAAALCWVAKARPIKQRWQHGQGQRPGQYWSSTGQRARERAEHGLRLEGILAACMAIGLGSVAWGVARRGGTAASRDFDRVAATLTATLTETLTVTLLLLLRLLRLFIATLTGLCCCGCCGCCGCGCRCGCGPAAGAAGRPPPWRT